jgi:hypothetical protein
MTYSFKEMKKLCLDLAEKAEPMEAEALHELAANYDALADRKIPENWLQRAWSTWRAMKRGRKLFNKTAITIGLSISIWLVVRALIPEAKMECMNGRLDGECVKMRPHAH